MTNSRYAESIHCAQSVDDVIWYDQGRGSIGRLPYFQLWSRHWLLCPSGRPMTASLTMIMMGVMTYLYEMFNSCSFNVFKVFCTCSFIYFWRCTCPWSLLSCLPGSRSGWWAVSTHIRHQKSQSHLKPSYRDLNYRDLNYRDLNYRDRYLAVIRHQKSQSHHKP